jgi:hypothetical protein
MIMKKKGVISVIVWIIVAVVVVGGAVVTYVVVSGGDDSPSGDSGIEPDQSVSESFDLPCGLKVDAPEGWKSFVIWEDHHFMYGPILDSGDEVRETVSIFIQDLTDNPATLEDFTEISFGTIAEKNILESGESTLGGLDAHRIIYTSFTPDVINSNSKFLEVLTVVGNTAYLITYRAEEKDYEKYLSQVETMIDSIEIAGDCYV